MQNLTTLFNQSSKNEYELYTTPHACCILVGNMNEVVGWIWPVGLTFDVRVAGNRINQLKSQIIICKLTHFLLVQKN